MLAYEEGRFVLSTTQKSDGFTLIELMVTIAIFSIALSLGLPSYRTWVQNTQIRNAAESIQNGILQARAEAVKRNTNVVFTLGTNSSWVISVVSDGTVIESRASSEGSKNVTVIATPTGATAITLSSLGTVVANVPASTTLTQVDLSSPLAPGSRALRVTIGLGGIVRMCDPNLATGSSPQAC
jgi:type IV fimbrial biogenesis protein FimT